MKEKTMQQFTLLFTEKASPCVPDPKDVGPYILKIKSKVQKVLWLGIILFNLSNLLNKSLICKLTQIVLRLILAMKESGRDHDGSFLMYVILL